MVPFHTFFVHSHGLKGARYTATELAGLLGVKRETVVAWIRRGWLRGPRDQHGIYRIRHRAVRRMLVDYPQTATAIMRERVAKAPRRA